MPTRFVHGEAVQRASGKIRQARPQSEHALIESSRAASAGNGDERDEFGGPQHGLVALRSHFGHAPDFAAGAFLHEDHVLQIFAAPTGIESQVHRICRRLARLGAA
jgi:hypothetical protein